MRCEPQIGECILRDIDALISSAQTSHPRWHDSIFWHSEKCLLWLKNVNLKNKKQCETAHGFPLVTVLSPLHWSQSTNSRKRAGLWLRCEQAPPMWVWRHCLAASCQERKNTWQHWKRELIGLEAFWLIQPFGNCSWLRSLLRMFAAVLQWSSVILLCVLLKFKWIWSSLRLLCMPYINYMTIAVVNLSYLKHHVVWLNCRFPGVLEQ